MVVVEAGSRITQQQGEARLRGIIAAATSMQSATRSDMVRNMELMGDWSGELRELRSRMHPERWRPAELHSATVFVEELVPFVENMQRHYNGTLTTSESAAIDSFVHAVVALLSPETLNALYSFVEKNAARFTPEFRDLLVESMIQSGEAPVHLLRSIVRGSERSRWIRTLAEKALEA